MKRSEMVKLIESLINLDGPGEVLAENILCHIEEAGMLPPRTKLTILNFEDNAWDPE